jgi:hypothetical protein
MATIRSVFIYRFVALVPPPPPPPPPPEQDPRIIDVPLNIGGAVLDIWDDNNCYLLVCTVSGVECLNSTTFGSMWYFTSTIIQSICSNQEKVCFGTVSSGIYYKDFPESSGDLGGGFLDSCAKITTLTSIGISDICTTVSGFFSGGENGIDIITNSGISDLIINNQLICSGTNNVLYSTNTGVYYWSTVSTTYSAYSDLNIKSTADPGYVINSINVEYISGGDVVYINTVSGIVRALSLTCSGIIGDRNIISSDYKSGDCGMEKIQAGYNTSLIEINIANSTEESFELVDDVSCLLYYMF